MSQVNKRTPTVRYIAASLIVSAFEDGVADFVPAGDALTDRFRSRISEEKRQKVVAEVQKFAKGLIKRCARIVEAHEHPERRGYKFRTSEDIRDLLLIIGMTVPVETISDWTDAQRIEACRWAEQISAKANDNPEARPGPRPEFLPDFDPWTG